MLVHSLTLGEAAEIAEATLEGDPEQRIWFGATLDRATPEAISFFDGRQPPELLSRTGAGAVLVPQDPPARPPGAALLRSLGPHHSFLAVVRALWERRAFPPPGIGATARIHPAARLSPGAHVADGCVIGAGAQVGDGAALHANVVVGDMAVIGPGTSLGAGAQVAPGTWVGTGCIVHAGTVLGFAYQPAAPGRDSDKPASFGGIVVGDRVEIGPNAVVEEGERGPTTIADDVQVGAMCFIGHDCSIGAGARLVAMVGLAGGVRIGAQALLMGQVGVSGDLRVGDRSVVFAKSCVTGHVPDDAEYLGYPAWPRAEWARAQAWLRRASRQWRPSDAGTAMSQTTQNEGAVSC